MIKALLSMSKQFTTEKRSFCEKYMPSTIIKEGAIITI